jgi:hypothetical protein
VGFSSNTPIVSNGGSPQRGPVVVASSSIHSSISRAAFSWIVQLYIIARILLDFASCNACCYYCCCSPALFLRLKPPSSFLLSSS